MMRRDDLAIPLKLGTMRATKSFLKLYCHGLVHVLDRKPTFDEMERCQAFLDSDEFKSYKSNLNKVMTKEAREFFKTVAEITDVKDVTDLCDLTAQGRKVLVDERAKMLRIYREINSQYKQTSADFYEKSSRYEPYLPMMVAMGLSGPLIGFMLASSDAQYTVLNNIMNGTAVNCGDFDSCLDGGFEFSELSF